MISDFDTITEFVTRIALAERAWRVEAHALEHGHTYCLRGPNQALPWQSAKQYADQLAQLLKAAEDILGPPELG